MKRLTLLIIGVAWLGAASASARPQDDHPNINLFFEAVSAEAERGNSALAEIALLWRDGYSAILLELTRVVSPPVRQRLTEFLEAQTGQRFGPDLDAWWQWAWDLPYDSHPLYGAFKGALYSQIDPRMAAFFPAVLPTTIRLDEVVWGGVSVNGIPPLDSPDRVAASEADYLADDDIVFGVVLNGESVAYPKRILAWHEMALDRVGGVDLTIIYCTLCGTVLPYESEVGGQRRLFGTSGLLYRSNKLFFDTATRSLWSTLEGRPVIGWLTGQDLELTLHSSVTTTWGEWRTMHPDTEVLSVPAGYDRDYGEGVAYRDYFATDALMFQVPETDARLRNKDEVLVMRLASDLDPDRDEPWAIASDFLERNRIYPFEGAGRRFVVITSPEGANRVFETGDVRFAGKPESEPIVDQSGRQWRLTEEALLAADDSGTRLSRVTANRAFWFGWYSQFPDTELIH